MSHPSFWGAVSSSVDFCEHNFQTSSYVAEPANTLSSFIIVLLGLAGLGLGHARQERVSKGKIWLDRAFVAMYSTLAMVGVGSVLLHLTLTAWGQAADEIPMLLLAIFILATLLELPAADKGLLRPWLPAATLAACGVTVAVYTTFREFYSVFLGCYISTVVVIVFKMGSLALRRRASSKAEEVRRRFIRPFFLGGVVAYLGCGSIAWIFDFLLCERVSLLLGPMLGTAILHPLWHLGAALGSFLAIQVLVAARAEAIDASPTLAWLGPVPVVAYNDDNDIAALSAATNRHEATDFFVKPPVVLVCGPSGCGKTTFAAALAQSLQEAWGSVQIVHQDSYFTRRFRSYAERQDDAFEGPKHIAWERLHRDVASAAVAVQKEASAAANDDSLLLRDFPRGLSPPPVVGTSPRGAVIVEGHVIATDTTLCQQADFAVVFEGTEATCRKRRLSRSERTAADRDILKNYYTKFVWPAFLRYGKPAQDALARRFSGAESTEADAKSSGKGEESSGSAAGRMGRMRCLVVPGDSDRAAIDLAKEAVVAMRGAGVLW